MMSDYENHSPADILHDLRILRLPPAKLRGFESLGSASQYEDEILRIVDHNIWLFEDLRPEEVSQLCAEMRCYAAPRGGIMMHEGEEGDFLAIVLTGEVTVVKSGEIGEMKQIATVGPGASLGEMSLIDGRPRFASCIACQPCDFAVLTRDSLYDILVVNPALGNKILLILLQIVSQRLRDTSSKLLPFIDKLPV